MLPHYCGYSFCIEPVVLETWFEVSSSFALDVETKHIRRPAFGRDASWLLSAEIVAILLAFIGQIILTRNLLASDYGWFILAIDVYATIFLVTDLGLPTLLARDGPKDPSVIGQAIKKIYSMQLCAFVVFLIIALVVQPLDWFEQRDSVWIVSLCIAISFIHIASYSPRAGLRAMGYANHEAYSKVIERGCIVLGYFLLASKGVTTVEWYAAAFLFGGLVSVLYSLFILNIFLRGVSTHSQISVLGEEWYDTKTLFFSALPFAITLSILPYVIRIEKFLVAYATNVEIMAVFHVAQLAWLAGLVVPTALRSAMLPVLGQDRGIVELQHQSMNSCLSICFGLLPIGLYGGQCIVAIFAPLAFPQQYFDGTLGANAINLFSVLLLGWSMTLLSTPTYTLLQTDLNPWKFTIFIAAVTSTSFILGWILIVELGSSSRSVLYLGSLAATLSALFLYLYSVTLSDSWQWVMQRKEEWVFALVCTSFIVLGFVGNSLIWLFGLPLFLFIPQALRAMRSTLS